jgi:hypothetical protein
VADIKQIMEQSSEFQCVATAREQQWLYQLGDEGIVYSQAQNRIAGLDAAGLLAYWAFDAGASLDDLQAFSTASQRSQAAELTLDTIFALSRGRFPKAQDHEERGDWPALDFSQSATVEVHGIPMLVECPQEALRMLCSDCFKSCPLSNQPARFHLRIVRAGTSWAISANDREIFAPVRDEQIGLGLLHAVRSLLYDEAPYDVAFHAAMIADSRHGIMLCAPREFGKSTLSAYLSAHGFDLVSDEPAMLCLDTSSISPVEMPISLKEGTWRFLEDEWPQLADAPIHVRSDGRRIRLLHLPHDRAAHAPRQLTHIVFPKYSPASPASLEALSPIRRFTLLNEGGMLLGKQLTKDKFEHFLRLICATPAFVAHYRSLQEAAGMIESIVNASSLNAPAGR